MATRIYSLNRGQTLKDVVEGVGSSTTGDVDVTFDLTKFPDRASLIIALENIKQHILNDVFKPA